LSKVRDRGLNNYRRVRDTAARVGAKVLVPLVAYGVILLSRVVTGWADLAVWLFVAFLLWLRIPLPFPRRWYAGRARIARFIGSLFVPLMALVGANGIWAWVGGERPAPTAGLALAAVFAGLAVYAYLRSEDGWVDRTPRLASAWAVGIVFVFGALPVLAATGPDLATEDPDAPVVVDELDVMVVSSDRELPPLAPERTIDEWDVHTWAGLAEGRRVRWGSEGEPVLRADADPAVAIVPEAEEQPGEVERWLAIADSFTDGDAPILVLLPGADTARRDRWTTELRRGRRRATVAAVESLGRRGNVSAAAYQMATQRPTADEDLALALRHRPAIFFDSSERYALPLNADALLRSGAFRLCPDDQGGPVLACEDVNGAGDLHNGPNHLEFDTNDAATATDLSNIYVNVTRHGPEGEQKIYLDYWWYLPDNPSYAAGGALCGAGFVVVGATCFDHQSDWEGVTVALEDAGDEQPRPTAVHYAGHAFRTGYSWATLNRLWQRRRPRGRALPPGAAALVGTTERPLVFVANGTHASYPTNCPDECRQADGVLEEQRSNGRKPWRRNGDEACARATRTSRLRCVVLLPTRHGGAGLARWNAYDGPWGTSDCDFLNLCRSSPAPRAPGSQGRFRKPWCVNRVHEYDERAQFRRRRAECPVRP
jgi:hypothetical protein